MEWLAALLGGLLLVGHNQVHQFEQHAGAEIASRLQGEHRTVEVRSTLGPEAIFGDVYAVTLTAQAFEADGLPLFTEPNRSTRGILRHLKLAMTDFTMRGLHVKSLTADIPDCRFDLPLAIHQKQIRLTRSGVGPGEVVLTEADLADFIKLKLHEIDRVTVRLDKDKIFVDGHGEFVLFESDFSIVAKLEPFEGTKLRLTFAHVLLDGTPATPAAQQALLDTLNPVIDLNKDLLLHDAITVTKLKVGNSEIHAYGDTKIPEIPGNKQG